MDDILTVEEVAHYLKVSRTTVWRWCNRGILPAFKVGRNWRVHRQKIKDLVEGPKVTPPHTPQPGNS